MSDYYLLAKKDHAIACVKNTGRSEFSETLNLTPVNTRVSKNGWLRPVKNYYFRVSALADIMYHYKKCWYGDTEAYVIYSVVIEDESALIDDEVGHHDGASSFSLYNGMLASSVKISESYDLSQLDDLKKLIELGFFHNSSGSLFRDKNLQQYFQYLINTGNLELFSFLYQQFPDFALLSDVVRSQRKNILEFILAYGFEKQSRSNLQTIYWSLMISVDEKLIDIQSLLLPYCKKKDDILFNGLLKAIDEDDLQLINHYFSALKNSKLFDKLAAGISHAVAREKLKLILDFVKEVLPDLSDEQECLLIRQAVACESNDFLSLISDVETKISKLRVQSLDAIFKNSWSLKQAVENADIVACEKIAQGSAVAELNDAVLQAAESGYIAIVNVLIKHGGDASYCSNFTIKYANKYQYKKLKNYLLGLGLPDVCFSS